MKTRKELDLTQAAPSIRFAYFDGMIRDGKPEYQFTLKAGVSDQRFGLYLLEQEGIPALLAEMGG